MVGENRRRDRDVVPAALGRDVLDLAMIGILAVLALLSFLYVRGLDRL